MANKDVIQAAPHFSQKNWLEEFEVANRDGIEVSQKLQKTLQEDLENLAPSQEEAIAIVKAQRWNSWANNADWWIGALQAGLVLPQVVFLLAKPARTAQENEILRQLLVFAGSAVALTIAEKVLPQNTYLLSIVNIARAVIMGRIAPEGEMGIPVVTAALKRGQVVSGGAKAITSYHLQSLQQERKDRQEKREDLLEQVRAEQEALQRRQGHLKGPYQSATDRSNSRRKTAMDLFS